MPPVTPPKKPARKPLTPAQRARIQKARKTIAPEALTGRGTLKKRVTRAAATLPTKSSYGNQRSQLVKAASKYAKNPAQFRKSVRTNARAIAKKAK
jgi:hypothetical protein